MTNRLEPAQRPMMTEPSGHDGIGLLDPRSRVIAAAVFALVAVSLSAVQALVAALGVSLVLMLRAQLPAGPTLRRMASMDGLMLFVLLLLPFTTPGTPMFAWGGLVASEEGLRTAIEILLKANAIVLALLALVGSLDAVTLGHALARLRVPAKLTQLLFFTVRYIDVIGDESRRLRTAMRARAFRPRNRLHTYRSLGYLVGMLLVRSLERSERILAAMRCRGFQGRFHVLDDFAYGRADARFAALALVTLTLLFILDR